MVESDSESNSSSSSSSSNSGSSSSEGECSTSSQSGAESKSTDKQVPERDDKHENKPATPEEEKKSDLNETTTEIIEENGSPTKEKSQPNPESEKSNPPSEPLTKAGQEDKSTDLKETSPSPEEVKEKNKSPVQKKSQSPTSRQKENDLTRRRGRSRSGSPQRKRDRSRSPRQSRRERSSSKQKSRGRYRSRSRSPQRRPRSRNGSKNRLPRPSSLERRREERKRRHAERDKRDEGNRNRRDDSRSPKQRSNKTPDKTNNNDIDNATVTDPKAKITERQRRTVDLLTSRTGGAYIPPAKLRMMQAEITDKSSAAYQRIAWEALKKSIHGYINKVNVDNIAIITRELLKENIVRGRGLLCRSIIQAQAASPTFTHVYAALVSIINSKFPKIGELLLTRLVVQFKRAFRRNDKAVCLSASRFVAHLVNQRVAHEILALEILTLLVETPTDDSVEVAIAFLKECGMKLSEVSSKGIGAIFEMLKNILHEGKLDKRVQYMIEVVFQVRKDGFKDHQSVLENLELVEEDDQFTHLLMLDDATNTEDILNGFKFDENYAENEDKYKGLSKEILGTDDSDSDGSGSSGSDSESGDSGDDDEDQEAKATAGDIIDNTETNLIALRRTIYLTINSSLDYEECAHKLMKMELKPGQEIELCHMFLDCCAEQRTYEKFYGLLAQRFCAINKIYIGPFEEIFRDTYQTTHRLDTNRLRNVSKFFAHLLFTDAISWDVLECIKLNEDDTTSSSRIFVKILFQELAEYMGLGKLNNKLKEDVLMESLAGLFPKDNPRNTRFSINFFTSIGLGGLTDDLRRFLKTAPKVVPAINAELLANQPVKENSSAEESSSSTSSSSSSSESSSSSSDSESESSDSEPERKRKRKEKKKQNRKEKEKEEKKRKEKEEKKRKEKEEKKRKEKEEKKKKEKEEKRKEKAKAKAKKLEEKESQKKKRKAEHEGKKIKNKRMRKNESSSSSDSSESTNSSSSSSSSESSDEGSSSNETQANKQSNKKQEKHKNRIDREEFDLNNRADRRFDTNGNGKSYEPQYDRRLRDENVRQNGSERRRQTEQIEESGRERRERGDRDESRRNDRRDNKQLDNLRENRNDRKAGVRDGNEERRDRRHDRNEDKDYDSRQRRDRRDRGEDSQNRRERDRKRDEYEDSNSRKNKKHERRRESPDSRFHSRNTSKERG